MFGLKKTKDADRALVEAIFRDMPLPREAKKVRTVIDRMLNTIPNSRITGGRNVAIFRLRYPKGASVVPLSDVARKVGVSKERIRQIEAKIFRQLRHPSRNQHIHAAIDVLWREDELKEIIGKDAK